MITSQEEEESYRISKLTETEITFESEHAVCAGVGTLALLYIIQRLEKDRFQSVTTAALTCGVQ